MAKKRVIISDVSSRELTEKTHVRMRTTLSGAKEGGFTLDLHVDEVAKQLPKGVKVKPRRGYTRRATEA